MLIKSLKYFPCVYFSSKNIRYKHVHQGNVFVVLKVNDDNDDDDDDDE